MNIVCCLILTPMISIHTSLYSPPVKNVIKIKNKIKFGVAAGLIQNISSCPLTKDHHTTNLGQNLYIDSKYLTNCRQQVTSIQKHYQPVAGQRGHVPPGASIGGTKSVVRKFLRPLVLRGGERRGGEGAKMIYAPVVRNPHPTTVTSPC